MSDQEERAAVNRRADESLATCLAILQAERKSLDNLIAAIERHISEYGKATDPSAVSLDRAVKP